MSNGLTVIESSGTTSLLTDGTYYYLQTGSGPAVELSYNGAPVTVGEFAQYGYDAPIAAAQTASGYEIAWKSTSGDQYQIWLTDSSGNELSIPFLGSGAQVELYEASFNYDLNGDGTIGLTVIESSGTMSLLTDGTHYYLQPNGGTPVELSYNGAPVTAGEFAQYGYDAPIAAAQTASGYEVAWKSTSGDQYQIWTTDSSGNYLSSPFLGSGVQVESYEASFNHDLNGDGILTDGTNYYLQPAGGQPVELSYAGAPVTVGEFAQYGDWTPIAAAQTASGYEVAWSNLGADQFQIWLTDSSGNELSIPFLGSGAQVEWYEASFNYDLNGDGTIGPTVIESSGTMSLLTDGTNYYLQPDGGPAVELSYNGAPVTAGEFAQYGYDAPIAAAQTASGYEVAWKSTSGDQYQIWTTDSSGNYLSSPFLGTGVQVEPYETSFNYDLNGDGTIGVPSGSGPTNGGGSTLTVIESSGTMSLLTDGTHYYLQPNGGPAVELSYNGAPVTAGEFAQYGYDAPIAAAQTASGYEVAWKSTSGDQYQIWTTDSSGNYLSSPFLGTGVQVEPYETSFNYDLNGDGTIGVPSGSGPTNGGGSTLTVIESSGTMSLLTDGTHYYLQPNGGPAVELSYNGAPVTAGEFAQYGYDAPIAAAQTASGYEVAWKSTSGDQYQIWTTDSSGNYLSSPFLGTGVQVEPYETSFNYDLNGDGTIGVPSGSGPTNGGGSTLTVIESSGTMSLLTDGTHYYLQPNGGPAVELSYNGAPVTAGEFAQYGYDAPIAAAQTASGYEVAWKSTSGDQYQIWTTDSSGNYLSSPFLGTGVQVEPYETSFNYDLNGDGTIGVPPSSSSPPQFVYEGTDSTGAQVYNVNWSSSGLQPFEVRVLTPQDPSSDYTHSFLYALPVGPGVDQSGYGDGLNELANLNVENQYNATIIEPIFPMDPWYADNPNDPTINYESFVADLLPRWVASNFSTTGTEQNLLAGFSKSGYGALDLELKHPSVFSAVAAFDFPGDMTSYDAYGSSSANDYGTQANFQNNYELSASFINAHDASFTTQDRILISEGPAFQSQVADFSTLLTSQGVMHTLLDQTNDTHTWSGGWLAGAVAGLYGLEQNLKPSA